MSRRRRDRGAAAAGGDDYDIDEAFKVYDTDSDGFISKDEVGTVIRALGKCPTNKQLEEMLSGVEGHRVDKKQFASLYRQKMLKPADMERDMRAAFNALDKDGYGNRRQVMEEGMLRVAELKQMLITLGEGLAPREVDALLKDIPVDANGCVSYDEFVDRLVS